MKIALAIVIALIVVIGGYFLFVHKAQAPVPAALEATSTDAGTQAAQTGSADEDLALAAPGQTQSKKIVSYTGSSFSPASLTVKKGEIVTFVNNSNSPMWVASDPHPTHQGYSGTTASEHCPDTAGTAFDSCAAVPAGGVYTFTFQKTGSWGYHNHLNHDATGTIVVTQ